jgi:GH25 family lysozyme M1 (1,4-beta-N-acetylmuramidase)
MSTRHTRRDSMILEKGHEGQEVRRLQTLVGGLAVDGDFGPNTEAAVKGYQSANGLDADGVVGEETLGKLGMNVYPGIDVSHHNGKIDWDNVDQKKVAFVWTKISEGRTFKDKRRMENLEGCRRNGIPVGGYHFGRPENHAPKTEVHHFLKSYGGSILQGDLTPVLDLEHGVKGDPDHNRQWALEWLQECEKEVGRKPLIYTAKWFIRGWLKSDCAGLDQYPLWVADYIKDPRAVVEPDYLSSWKEWTVWQWSSKGGALSNVGVKRCDVNWLPGGPSALNSLLK